MKDIKEKCGDNLSRLSKLVFHLRCIFYLLRYSARATSHLIAEQCCCELPLPSTYTLPALLYTHPHPFDTVSCPTTLHPSFTILHLPTPFVHSPPPFLHNFALTYTLSAQFYTHVHPIQLTPFLQIQKSQGKR